MGGYLGNYRARVSTWAGRFLWRDIPMHGDRKGTTGDCFGLTVVSSMVLGVLLMISRNEQHPGPVLEVENIVRMLCTVCGRNLK